MPLVPRDGTLLKELGRDAIYVTYAGGHFGFPNPDAFNSIGMDWGSVRAIPLEGLAQIPSSPADYNRFREVDGDAQYAIVRGQKLPLDSVLLDILLEAGHANQLYTLWDGALDAFPDITLVRGDTSCDGDVTAVDALRILQETVGIPHLGFCVVLVGNVDCDADTDVVDALKILRWVAGLPTNAPAGCPAIGTG